uniref:Apple domain-containing protein n=1 Tax=Branchiostoma floridae TaxID=7739 RepID=C3YRM2_BRAFL|eukprot:XP_002601207.1 hypothetical protein BRAFLDRAFT_75651 [Branchiostoma floridae]
MAQQTPHSPVQIPQPDLNIELGPAGPNGRHPALDDTVRLAAMANWPRDYIYPFRDVPAPEQEPNNDLDAKNSPSGSNEPQLAQRSAVHVAEMPNWPQDYIYPFRDVPAPEEDPNNDPGTTGPADNAVKENGSHGRLTRAYRWAKGKVGLSGSTDNEANSKENGFRDCLTRVYRWIAEKVSWSRLFSVFKTTVVMATLIIVLVHLNSPHPELQQEHPDNNSAQVDHPDNHASTADHLLNISRLEDKVSALEDRLDNRSALNILLEDDITSLENHQKNDRERNSRLGDQVSTLEESLSSRSALVSRLKGQMSTLEKQHKNHQAQASRLQDRVATLEKQFKNGRTQSTGSGNQRATIEQHSGLLKSIQTRISSFGKNLQEERKFRIQLEEAVAQLPKRSTDLPKGAENGGVTDFCVIFVSIEEGLPLVHGFSVRRGDCRGNDIWSIAKGGITLEDCAERCMSHADCVAFMLYDNKACWPKTKTCRDTNQDDPKSAFYDKKIVCETRNTNSPNRYRHRYRWDLPRLTGSRFTFEVQANSDVHVESPPRQSTGSSGSPGLRAEPLLLGGVAKLGRSCSGQTPTLCLSTTPDIPLGGGALGAGSSATLLSFQEKVKGNKAHHRKSWQ